MFTDLDVADYMVSVSVLLHFIKCILLEVWVKCLLQVSWMVIADDYYNVPLFFLTPVAVLCIQILFQKDSVPVILSKLT